MNLFDYKTFFFAGIGGIGMSALARYFLLQGKQVIGYDHSLSSLTQALAKEGALITNEVKPELLKKCDVFIYTPALAPSDPYRVAASNLGIPSFKRAQVLGEISKSYQTIAVAGTHGKTTTSSLITWLLYASGVPCTAFIGGISQNLGSNFVYNPSSNLLVVEADEFDRSFLTLSPYIAIITTIDPDHLDIYENTTAFQNAFLQFANQILPQGYLFIGPTIEKKLFSSSQITIQEYGKDSFYAEVISAQATNQEIDFYTHPEQKWLSRVNYPQPGVHNLENLCAALSVIYTLEIPKAKLYQAIATYQGVKRRWEVVLQTPEWIVIDDYAHHPTEIEATLKTVRTCFKDYHLWVVFQPHLYSRTRDFAKEFAQALSMADKVFLLPVYAAREKKEHGANETVIFQHLPKNQAKLVNLNTVVEEIISEIQPLTVLITMGAGNVDSILPELLQKLEPRISIPKV
ncbi:MAG: UDP-N-acetylmuramate--L-alanine ligase [Bacteroidia bacterium]|nr:UDP-N-acetylmuramate--L-alanine ligase [Bacteroidia bacterium]MDW8158457.1 UDP-N-acetylmuramate--L-alanine ligase [Bacteroidia bacterium]